jgi:hypothetical protein
VAVWLLTVLQGKEPEAGGDVAPRSSSIKLGRRSPDRSSSLDLRSRGRRQMLRSPGAHPQRIFAGLMLARRRLLWPKGGCSKAWCQKLPGACSTSTSSPMCHCGGPCPAPARDLTPPSPQVVPSPAVMQGSVVESLFSSSVEKKDSLTFPVEFLGSFM